MAEIPGDSTRTARTRQEREGEEVAAGLRPAPPPDYYRGSYEAGKIKIEKESTPTSLVAQFATEVVVRPPVESEDEAALRDQGSYGGRIGEIVTPEGGDTSTMHLAFPSFEPQRMTVEWAMDKFNEARASRLGAQALAQSA